MRTSVSAGRLKRKGVEAIFSTPRKGLDRRFLTGLLALMIGIILVVAVGLKSQFSGLFGIPEISLYLSVLLSSLGLCLVVLGAGVCVSYSGFSYRLKDNQPIDRDDATSANSRKTLDLPTETMSRDADLSGRVVMSQNIALGLVAFLESCIVLALYAGLADEFRSNIGMRVWIRSNFPLVQSLLNWPTALIIGAVLGLLLVQFLPGRRLAR